MAVISNFRNLRIAAAMIVMLMFVSCNPHTVHDDVSPVSSGNDAYTLRAEGIKQERHWWKALNDKTLDIIIKKALSQNLTIKEFSARLEQAIAAETVATSFRYPDLTIRSSAEEGWTDQDRSENSFTAGAVISWEVDLWKRLSSADKAAAYDVRASRDDLEATAILLTSQVAETYYGIIEQHLQLKLLQEQIEAGDTLLELIELRFGYGEATVVDVFQQRQQLASTRSQLPVVHSRLRTLENHLYVLMGMAPANSQLSIADNLPELPELPHTGVPSDLLTKRPDLRKIYYKLMAADYRIAEAVADRFPKIDLTANASFRDRIATEGILLSLLLEAAAPVIDWDRRRAEVDKQKAVFQEELARYSHAYLTAMEEVENALWQEKYQNEFLTALRDQISIARSNLTESRSRYQQGSTDYLPVLTALQSLQRLERDILSAKKQLISDRILLYRALGGSRLSDNNNLLTASDNIIEHISKGDSQ